MQRTMRTALLGAVAMTFGLGAVGVAQAFNPQPEPPKALLVCSAQDNGEIVVSAFDTTDASSDIRIGMSCLGAVRELMGKDLLFDLNFAPGPDGTAHFGIIIVDGKPAEF